MDIKEVIHPRFIKLEQDEDIHAEEENAAI
jgi:hypothetical protein